MSQRLVTIKCIEMNENKRLIDTDKNYWNKVEKKHSSTSPYDDSMLKHLDSKQTKEYNEKVKQYSKFLSENFGKPTYEDNGFFIYKQDCLKFLKKYQKINKFKFDLTVTSPPYNIGKEYEEIMSLDEYIEWSQDWMELVFNNTSKNGAFWLNLGYLEVNDKGKNVPISYLIWDKSQFFLQQEVVWHYGAGVSARKYLSPRNEKWLWYLKNKDDYIFNLDDIRDPNVKYPNQKKNGKFRVNPLGKNPSDVWIFPKVTSGNKRSSKERTKHPAQFPLKVVDRIIKGSSNFNEIVLDPFSGSASTGIAASGLKRIYLGIEIKDEYIEESISRYESFKKLTNR